MHTIRDVATQSVRTIDSTATVREAAQLMAQHDTDFLDVIHEGVSAGILSDHDIVVRVVAEGADPDEIVVSAIISFQSPRGDETLEVLNAGIATLSGETPIDEALEYMERKHVHRLIVHDAEYRTEGVVTRSDLGEASLSHN